jgi:hypothetical protein
MVFIQYRFDDSRAFKHTRAVLSDIDVEAAETLFRQNQHLAQQAESLRDVGPPDYSHARVVHHDIYLQPDQPYESQLRRMEQHINDCRGYRYAASLSLCPNSPRLGHE